MEAEVIESGTDLITEVKETTFVRTSDQYSRVAMLRGLINDMAKRVTEDTQPAIDSAKEHYELLKDQRDEKLDPLRDEYRRLGALLGDYNSAQEIIKKRRELEIEAANKLAAEKERAELSKIAKDMGARDLAKEILKAPVDVAPVVVTKDVPVVEGLSYAESWHYAVDDLAALVKAVGAGKVPIQAIADPSKPFRSGYLHKQATALKNMLNYPGVRTWMTKEPRQS